MLGAGLLRSHHPAAFLPFRLPFLFCFPKGGCLINLALSPTRFRRNQKTGMYGSDVWFGCMKARRVATSRPYRLAAPRRAARRTAHAMVHLAASVEADLDAFVQDLKRRCGPRHCALLLLHPRRAPSRGAAREPDARARALEPSNAHPALGFHARTRSGAARRRRARRGGPCCQQRQPPKGKRTRGAALLGHQREPIDAPTPRNCWPSSTRAAGGVAARAAARSARGSRGRSRGRTGGHRSGRPA